ncbi:MAG: class I SAM-dependent methyltransferase [Christensenellaceae bacterium]|nr:class I SAM-dependent methyltransferase [Christensenellaceae bacterium]
MSEKAFIRPEVLTPINTEHCSEKIKLNLYEKSMLECTVIDKNETVLCLYSNNEGFFNSLPSNNFVFGLNKNLEDYNTLKNSNINAEISFQTTEDMPFENEFFNHLIIAQPLHKINNLDNVLSEAFRMLKSGGQLIFSCNYAPFNSHKIINSFCKDEFGFQRDMFLSKDFITKKIKNNFFQNLDFYLQYGFINVGTAWKR